ncbi:MAG: hypothetical protein BWY95_02010 [Bacteroidetes bacterium ADurb.BinA104]|nr:MAG: hypothetical protein BWY95_02010 [Bacteroidetes bacterium ADurb.BinA104]
MATGNIRKSCFFSYIGCHLDLFAYTVNQSEVTFRKKDCQRYSGEPAPGTYIGYLCPLNKFESFGYSHGVQDMMFIQVVNVFARNDINFTVPVRV